MTAAVVMNTSTRVSVEREELPDGTLIWVARDLDLDGCVAQAESYPAVLAALEEARTQYQSVLRELQTRNGATVAPERAVPTSTATTAVASYIFPRPTFTTG